MEEAGYIQVISKRPKVGKRRDELSLTAKGYRTLQQGGFKDAIKIKRDMNNTQPRYISELLDYAHNLSFTKETDPEKRTMDIIKMLDIMDEVANCIFKLADVPNAEVNTTVEEHLATLREVTELIQPYLGCVMPVPIDYVPSSTTSDSSIFSDWIQKLRDAKAKESSSKGKL